ncbi:hypothetical protein [Parvibaculum sp.]|uniref:hypothetical protein n=1 Tax=Parvibaculum sp. TaxID=2024848 RepID=UPI00320DDE83
MQTPDIIFVSFDEPNADEHFERLKSFAPSAKRLHGVRGIYAAYQAVADLAATPYFYMVDADSWILDGFSFAIPEGASIADIQMWSARNAVNGLRWFNGGLKLLSRSAVRSMKPDVVDFFSSMEGSRVLTTDIATETRFNATPFLAWRAAFRECTKLTGRVVRFSDAAEHLKVWQTQGADKLNGAWCMLGARMGANYGLKNPTRQGLVRVNDMEWLKSVFDEALRINAIAVIEAEIARN